MPTAGARFILLGNVPVPALREAAAAALAYDGARLEACGGLKAKDEFPWQPDVASAAPGVW